MAPKQKAIYAQLIYIGSQDHFLNLDEGKLTLLPVNIADTVKAAVSSLSGPPRPAWVQLLQPWTTLRTRTQRQEADYTSL